MKHRILLALSVSASLSLALAGCGGEVTGSLTIDGEPAQLTRCASGEHVGLPGAVDVTTDRGSFRFSRTDDGQTEISYLVSGVATIAGIPIPQQRRNVIARCGPMSLRREDYQQNEVYPLSGEATVDCTNVGTSDPDPHTFRGTLVFDRCR